MSTFFPISKSGDKFKLRPCPLSKPKCLRKRGDKLPRGKVWSRLSQLEWTKSGRQFQKGIEELSEALVNLNVDAKV